MTGLFRMVHFVDLGGNGKGADLSPTRLAVRKRLVPVKGGGSTVIISPPPPPPPSPPPGTYYYAPFLAGGI
jgi:hypothetical protein